jgi:hypothetical protein
VTRQQLPAPARAIVRAAIDAVSAAQAADPQDYRTAVEQLAAQDSEHVGLVLGAVVRMLLEEAHPDGLTADDMQQVLERAARTAAAWWPEVDPQLLLVLLTGALGLHFSEEEVPRLTPFQVAGQAPLLIADLLAVRDRRLDGYLTVALAEIMRAETMEMP